MKKIRILIPTYNEEENVEALASAIIEQHLMADISKIKKDINWYPKHTFQEGIKITIDSLR